MISDKMLDIKRVPPSLIRFGRLMMVGAIVLLIVVLWFLKVKQKLSGEITINSMNRPQEIYAMSSDLLVPLKLDGDRVQAGDVIGYVSGDFDYDEVQKLETLVTRNPMDWETAGLNNWHGRRSLGPVTESYLAWRDALFQLQLFDAVKSRGTQEVLASKQQQVKHLTQQITALTKGDSVLSQQVALWNEQLDRQRRLLESEVISKQDYEEMLRGKLGSESDRTTAAADVQRLLVERESLNQELSALRQGKVEGEATLQNNVEVARMNLQADLNDWRHKHLLVANMDGVVSYTDFITGTGEHVRVEEGALVATISPTETQQYIGLMRVPPDGIGMVRPNQHVRIMLRNYPSQEFGSLGGTVSKISAVPVDGQYNVWVAMDSELSSSYGRDLAFMQGMEGQAEIVISRQSILEKGYNAVRWRLSN